MKSLAKYLGFEVPNRRGFVNLTPTVEALIGKSGVQEGFKTARTQKGPQNQTGW